MSWQSCATLETLRERANFLQAIRHFFEKRNVWEVDTPLLCQSTVTAPHLQSFALGDRFLQTSPEYAMKRLLAMGADAIYYLGKVFRQEEVGSRHNPEFTMLEWYRVDWTHWQLIEEVDALFQALLGTPRAKIYSYHELFFTYFDINPHLIDINTLQTIALNQGWVDALPDMDKDAWLDLLMSHGIEPHLGKREPTVVVDFPASQASLAKTRRIENATYHVAERFEFYYQGVELANGYHELADANELRARFNEDNHKRKTLGLNTIPIDEALLAALKAGLPPCSGVALGVDRLFMLKTGKKHIKEVLAFDWQRA
ncbi:MAG: EF-P lysine aminoacylase GenX [Proteobacteria bacterium]|nr:EF-P lysine aminoacylase GenX [Pseudomonadota bacterium]